MLFHAFTIKNDFGDVSQWKSEFEKADNKYKNMWQKIVMLQAADFTTCYKY